MTERTERDHRRQEMKVSVQGRVGRRALSRRTSGLDGLAKRLLARQVGTVDADPELDHPAEWDRPID